MIVFQKNEICKIRVRNKSVINIFIKNKCLIFSFIQVICRCIKERGKTMGIFTGKTLMITGGTGSFGNVVLNRFLKTDIGEIRVFSRDEKKQDDMRHDFQVRMPEVADKIKFPMV